MKNLPLSDHQLLFRFGIVPESCLENRRRYFDFLGVDCFFDVKTGWYDIVSPYRRPDPRASLLLILLAAQEIREWLDATSPQDRLSWSIWHCGISSVSSPVGPASAPDAVCRLAARQRFVPPGPRPELNPTLCPALDLLTAAPGV